jgi:hypothetical protein
LDLPKEVFVRKELVKGNFHLILVVRGSVKERLKSTCFRGKDKPLAGNFFRWESVEKMFSDDIIVNDFVSEIRDADLNREFETLSFEFDCGVPVGWASTDELDSYDEDDLEQFQPNRRSTAMRVRLDRRDIPAPKVNRVTFVVENKVEAGTAVVVLHSVYPGGDIGKLSEDITSREGVVFFDWNHPGEKM